jgi:hypothetical protein
MASTTRIPKAELTGIYGGANVQWRTPIRRNWLKDGK